MAAIAGSNNEITQYLSLYTISQRNFNDSTLIVQANELNGTCVINVDVGYVCISGNGGHLCFNTYPRCRRVSALVLPRWRTSKM